MQKDESHESLKVQRQIDAICDEFEAAFRAGSQPRIEVFLDRFPETLRRPVLAGLLSLELQLLGRERDTLELDVYRVRFPDDVQVIEEVLQRTIGSSELPEDIQDSDGVSITEDSRGQVPQTAEPQATPDRLGRYEILRVLGQGAFGRVYLAEDPQLNRQVALKVPSRKAFGLRNSLESFLEEARNAARLKHAGLVTVHDVEVSGEQPYIVQEYIDGMNLREWKQAAQPTTEKLVVLLVDIVDSVAAAHQQGVVHRDLKPTNILVDHIDKPHVADFGMALHESTQQKKKGEVSGSPAYMSPEQVRGETHRLDGRTDIWSIGVILYEMLLDKRPFSGERRELFEAILSSDPRPPRQLAPTISKELERICLKCLEKRRSDRYMSAADLLDDLRHWLSTAGDRERTEETASISHTSVASSGESSTGLAPIIVPKGLRSFDRQDSDFYLDLLPGPRDRDGLPESIRFWKTRLEDTDAQQTFSVGLIYGPSGCGKSSLVKAGLLPRLASRVTPVYIEATPQDTESRLLKSLAGRVPGVPRNCALPDAIRHVREHLGSQQKVVVVLDQFEQWLHLHGRDETSSLVDAIRHCDGARVQCVVMVRDDFWMEVTRFMRNLEVRLVEGENSAAVDLFPRRHAEKVLTRFGRAYGCLDGALSESERAFVSQSVDALAEGRRVVCVRLSLYADIMKDKVWAPSSLKAVGGVEGVGVTFLEETFSASTAPPKHRLHERAARNVLEALLPESGSNIKGAMRSHAELLDASGYSKHEERFADLLYILDGELRLITPTSPDGQADGDDASSSAGYYQLTHDYLVPSLREWLIRKLKATRQGRAEIALADRAALWNSKSERKQLPTWLEWAGILALTRSRMWTHSQRKMMSVATRFHVARTFGVVVAALVLMLLFVQGMSAIRARGLTEQLVNANTSDVPEILQSLEKHSWAEYFLRAAQKQYQPDTATPDEARKLTHLSLALLPIDQQQAEYLWTRLFEATPQEFALIRKALRHQLMERQDELWNILEGLPGYDQRQRFRVAAALALADPADPRWKDSARAVAALMASEPPASMPQWSELFQPVQQPLIPELQKLTLSDQDQQLRINSADVLARYLKNDAEAIIEMIGVVDPSLIHIFLSQCDPAVVTRLRTTMERTIDFAVNADTSNETEVQKCGNVALGMMLITEDVAKWPLLEFRPDPTIRTYLIHNLSIARLGVAKIAEYASVVDTPLTEVERSRRRALLLSLAETSPDQIPAVERIRIVERLKKLVQKSSDPGIHAASSFLLRNWNIRLPVIDVTDQESAWPSGTSRWYVDEFGNTMVIVPGVESQPELPRQDSKKTDQRPVVMLSHSFAISNTEVTVQQFVDCLDSYDYDREQDSFPDCPVNNVSVADAWEYCLTLSEKLGIPEQERCYRRTEEGDLEPCEHYTQRTGYRLPTHDEWEVACRGGTSVARFFGKTSSWLNQYAWTREQPASVHSVTRTHRVGQLMPNELGLFDVYGNVGEWSMNSDGSIMMNGATYVSTVDDATSIPRQWRAGQYRAATIGFRVVRTVRIPK